MIGKLEELVLLAALRADEDALANEIFALVGQGNSSVAFGAVYTTLTRLAVKGFLKERSVVDGTKRPRRGFTITPNGKQALSEALEASAKIGGWQRGGFNGALV